MNQSLKINLRSLWKGWVLPILTALFIATSIKSAVADWYIVPTGSMKPTIVEGDRVFVNKLAYDLKVPYTTWHLAEWGAPARGDIVVFPSPEDGQRLIKRVIGLPGDTIEMRNNVLFINGEELSYRVDTGPDAPYGSTPRYLFTEDLTGLEHRVMVAPDKRALRSFGPVTVPEESYFMMGDNRDNSKDSRYFGFTPRNRIAGRATSIVISLDINNGHRPRWERFFTALN
jgi:signal peptidase I